MPSRWSSFLAICSCTTILVPQTPLSSPEFKSLPKTGTSRTSPAAYPVCGSDHRPLLHHHQDNWKFEIHRNRMTKKLELKLGPGKCLFLYHYQIRPVFGFLNARIQTWFPFSVRLRHTLILRILPCFERDYRLSEPWPL